MYRSTLRLEGATAMGKEEAKKLLQVVQALLDDPESAAFAEPVDWQALGLLDYPTIVKTPMDLGTIKRNLLASRYQFIEECLDDLQLVWDCCRLYNAAGTWIMNIAVRLEKQLRRLVKNYLPSFNFSQKRRDKSDATDPDKKAPEPSLKVKEKEKEKEKARRPEPPAPKPLLLTE
jgi:hypothetical protein